MDNGGQDVPQIQQQEHSLPSTSDLNDGRKDASSDEQGSMSPTDGAHDLPLPLLHRGWRKVWSQKQKRPYYYNKLTQESVWECPSMRSSDPLGLKAMAAGVPESVAPFFQVDYEDPLGLKNCQPDSGPVPSPRDVRLTRNSTDIPPPDVVRKRRHSSVEGSESTPVKKAVCFVTSFWNFGISTNIFMNLRSPSTMPCPHPDTELLRSKLTGDLRASLKHNLQTREGIPVPVNAFNRALMAHKVRDKGTDPMMPTICDPEVCTSLVREIMNDIPTRLWKPKHISEARKMLCHYAEASKQMVETRQTTKEDRKKIMWHAEDTFDWLRQRNRASLEDYVARLGYLKRNCQSALAKVAKPSVENICLKWYHSCQEVARKVAERSFEILNVQNVSIPVLPEVPDRVVPCYPVHLISPSPFLPSVEYRPDQDYINLTYCGDTMRITSLHFQKLEQLYRMHCFDDTKCSKFLARVWCLLKRYQTFFGTAEEGYGMQAALSSAVFECLHRQFDVTFECFASPLNCYFKQYCSAFSDTDNFFGSRGPILDFYPRTGSLEANPPFCEELMEGMVDHFESLLSETEEPLSMIVFIPEWRDPPTEALMRLESSRFNKKQVVLPAYDHEYRHGMQHNCQSNEVNVKSKHGTVVVFLQNEQGFQKWMPTPEKIKELILSAKPK